MKIITREDIYLVPRVRVELTSEVFQTTAVTTLATSALAQQKVYHMFVVLRMFLYSMSMALTKTVDFIKQTWVDYKTHLRMIVTILLVPNILTQFIGQWGGHSRSTPGSFGLLFVILVTIFSLWSQVTIFMAIVKPSETLTFVDWYKKSWKYIWSYSWLIFLSGIIILSGILLFIVPGIIFSIWFSMGIYVLMDKHLKGMSALQYSYELVSGHWFAVFWRCIVNGILMFIASIGITILIKILHFPYEAQISGVLIATFVTPFTYMYSFRLYKELKEMRGNHVFTKSKKFFWTFIAITIAIVLIIPVLIIVLIVGSALHRTQKNIDSTKYNMEQMQNDNERRIRNVQEN